MYLLIQRTPNFHGEKQGVSNHWTGIWNGMMEWKMEWKMEWNSEHTQLQVTCVTVAAQSRLNHLVYLQACYLTTEALYKQVRHCPPSCFYILVWYRCWLTIRCFVIVVLQIPCRFLNKKHGSGFARL